jgi:hypothetical protein
MVATNNALNITASGLVKYDGAGTFTAVTVTNHAALIGAASNGITSTLLTNGQLLIGNTGNDPTAATLTAGTGVTIANAAGSITINAAGGGITWSDTSGVVTSAVNNGYFLSAAATPTLPASPAEGDVVAYVVDAAALVTITGNTGQRIRLGNTLSAAAGTCATSTQGNAIYLVYRSSGTTWFAISAVGSWTIT